MRIIRTVGRSAELVVASVMFVSFLVNAGRRERQQHRLAG